MMIQQPQWHRKAQIVIAAAACLLLCILILRQYIQHATHSIPHLNSKETSSRLPPVGQQRPQHKPSQTTCHDLPGASSVFVVLKTGATESQIKLPVHLATTLRCTPHYAIYSDLDEDIATVPIYDVFAGVPDSLKSASPDFAFYHLQHSWRRAGLNISAIALASSDMRGAAWTLDKWKFLPLMLRALADAPLSTPWFLFIEADTGIVWTNTLRWLQRLDARQALYFGGQNWLADDIFPFGHGGTGVVLSRPALVRLAGMLSAEPDVSIIKKL
ncbi:hypothetical protein MPH_02428 [Macrophomina phaseolina MS6]|uniref:Fringe-like protein n=1 Tax=Macrophomina phaseolina (strain MS6) TaxID=1126212 RepID=K2SUC8_MACPH|nr:hypothetical protein MPH_02428 [Macrophomina phaseolina MS6]